VAAFFQSYLVQAKGWGEKDLPSATLDTVLASIMYTLIGCVIMATAAAALYPNNAIDSAPAMAAQLEGAFGARAKLIFCVGYCAAAFSSFLTASLIGGVLLNDGLGLGGRLESPWTKVFATLVLLIGMGTSTGILVVSETPTSAAPSHADLDGDTVNRSLAAERATPQVEVKVIAVTQAVTMLVVPLAAIAMVVVLFDRRATGGRSLPLIVKAFVLFGAALLLGIALMMYVKLQPEISRLVR
jgi:Mn2+/Fe2+ NRAMP family transporter